MTVSEIIKKSGLKVSKNVISKIGQIIYNISKEKNIPHSRVPETVFVNDYPEDFIPEMEKAIIDYVSKNNQ